jgi:hypothetical protein
MLKTTLSPAGVLVLCGLLLIPALSAQVAAGARSGSIKLDAATAARLDDELRHRGTTRVVVELAAEDEPDARLQTGPRPRPSRLERRRQAVSRLQERLLTRTSGRAGGSKRLRNLPVVSLEVSPRGLEQLLADEDVATIRQDVLLRPALNESVPAIGGDTLWSLGYTGLGQAVAILDSGTDGSHPALAGKVIAEACFSTNNALATSLCPGGGSREVGPGTGVPCQGISGCSHGTHVAGIAGGDDGTYRGVAPDAMLVPIQVFSGFEDTSTCGGASRCVLTYYSDVLLALDWLYDQRDRYAIASANLSLGGGRHSGSCDSVYPALASLIDQLRTTGIATVVASGNDGYSDAMSFPACISSAISVGAVTAADGVAGFSSSSDQLDLLAPGTGITSTVPDGGFRNWNGTSMATPHVAGGFALLRSAAPLASVDEIMAALVVSGKPITDDRNGVVAPRIQLDEALVALGVVTEPPGEPPPQLRLLPGVLDSGRYGYGYGSSEHERELVILFAATGDDFEFSVTGYDIDRSNEIGVRLNGADIGQLTMGLSGARNGGDRFALPASSQRNGENRLVLTQRWPGRTWGVTDLLLTRVEASDIVEARDILLQIGELDSTLYGNGIGEDKHPLELGARFNAIGVDLALTVTGHDIDLDSEVAVFLNGAALGYLSAGGAEGPNGGDTFVLPAGRQSVGENRILFRQSNPGWIWGVTDLLLTAAVTMPPPLEESPAADHPVTLLIGQADDGRYGFDYGTSRHRGQLTLLFASAGSDLVLSARGFDVDNDTDVAVYLNEVFIGQMTATPRNSLNAALDTFSLPASLQVVGDNTVVLRQAVPGRKWGVTDLMLSR